MFIYLVPYCQVVLEIRLRRSSIVLYGNFVDLMHLVCNRTKFLQFHPGAFFFLNRMEKDREG